MTRVPRDARRDEAAAVPVNLYFVLYVPRPAADAVMKIRRGIKDNFFSELSVDVTLAGSTGVGIVDPMQDLAAAYRILDGIAETTAPIAARFGPVTKFPGTDIYALTFEDEAPLRALHDRIAKSGIKFHESPHRFIPHCTLRSGGLLSASEDHRIRALRVPGSFTLATLSVCRLDKPPVTLLHSADLTG